MKSNKDHYKKISKGPSPYGSILKQDANLKLRFLESLN